MTHMEQRITFHTAQVDTSGDGITLPKDAVLDNVQHVSAGEYVELTYHRTREVEVDDDDATPET